MIDSVIDALAAFLVLLMPTLVVTRGQTNRVPQANDNLVVVTEINRSLLETPLITYDNIATATVTGQTRLDLQLDFYGPVAGENANITKVAFESQLAFSRFSTVAKPLQMSELQQAPFVDGEHQYQNRWTLTASLQVATDVNLAEQFADSATPLHYPPTDLT